MCMWSGNWRAPVQRSATASTASLAAVVLLLLCVLLWPTLPIVCAAEGNVADPQASPIHAHSSPPSHTEYSEVVRVAERFTNSAGPWFCFPDADTALEEVEDDSDEHHRRATESATATEPAAIAEDERNRRLLSRLGIPFTFDTTNTDDILCFRRQLAFRVATVDGGSCPALHQARGRDSAAFNTFYFAFNPQELEERYGAARLSDWALAAAPWQWDAVKADRTASGQLLHAADAYVASRPSPPLVRGWVRLRMPSSWSRMGDALLISLADMTLSTGEDGKRPRTLPLLQFDGEAAGLRLQRQLRVRAKLTYGEGVTAYDAAVRREARRVVRAIAAETAKAQANYAEERHRRERYDAFVAERRARRLAASHTSDGEGAVASHNDWAIADEDRARRHVLSCEKLHRALATLASVPPSDSRVVGLRGLLVRRRCPDVALFTSTSAAAAAATSAEGREPDTHEGNDRDKQQEPSAARDSFSCRVVCSAAADVSQWSERTGQRPTTAQTLALLVALSPAEPADRDAAASKHSISEDEEGEFHPDDGEGSEMSESVRLARRIAARSTRWTFGGATSACSCVVPAALRAELYHTAALLDLLQVHHASGIATTTITTQTSETPQIVTVAGALTARGVAALHQALWLGSTQAASTLATLRERGLYMAQRQRVARTLLMTALGDAPSTFYRVLWREWRAKAERESTNPTQSDSSLTSPTLSLPPRKGNAVLKSSPIPRGDAGAGRGAAAATRAERLLRQESMYAMAHSFHDVDAPRLTRELVESFFAVADMYLYGADDDYEDDSDGDDHSVGLANRNADSVLMEEDAEAELAETAGDAKDGQGGGSSGSHRRQGGRLGSVAQRAKNKLGKAGFYLMGFKIRRDVAAAECELLSVLRSFDYLCDVQLLMLLANARMAQTNRDSPPSRTAARAVIVEQRAVCAAHDTALTTAFRHPHARRFRCPWRGSTEGHARTGQPFPLLEENFKTLQQTLTLLGYVYVVRGDYARAAIYARLAIQLSASALHEVGLERGTTGPHRAPFDRRNLPASVERFLGIAHTSGRAKAVADANRGLQSPLRKWWVRRAVTDLMDFDEELLVTAVADVSRARRLNVTWPPLALVDSSFPASEALTILAMSVLLDDVPYGGGWPPTKGTTGAALATSHSAHGETVAQWSARLVMLDAFAVPAEVLAATETRMGSIFADGDAAAGMQKGAAKPAPPPPQKHQQQPSSLPLTCVQAREQTAFVLLMAAASQWRALGEAGHTLDHTLRSLHTVDPFLMLTWLLADLSSLSSSSTSSTGEDGVSVAAVRRVATALGSRVIGARPFLPLPHDSLSSFSRRLLYYAMSHVRGPTSAVEAFHQGHLRAPNAASLAGTDWWASDRLSDLRLSKEHAMDRAHFAPLLFASDSHAYISRARGWTLLERVADAVRSSVAYLFTETNAEALGRKLGLEILSPPAWERLPPSGATTTTTATITITSAGRSSGSGSAPGVDMPVGDVGRADDVSAQDAQSEDEDDAPPPTASSSLESPAAFVVDYQERFLAQPAVRELTLAVLLLSAALELGVAEGFSLLFLEVAERGNPLLVPFADYMSRDWLTASVTAALWSDAHASAQWHLDKPRTLRPSTISSLNTHVPFATSRAEARQELMAAADRWRARRLVDVYRRAAGGPAGTPLSAANTHSGGDDGNEEYAGGVSNERRRLARSALLRATDSLARCSGLLVHAALTYYCKESGRTPPPLAEVLPRAPFDGMRFPAADPRCASDLVRLLQLRSAAAPALADTCGGSQGDGDAGNNGDAGNGRHLPRYFTFTEADASAMLESVSGDMLTRLAVYYDLTDEAAPRRVLLSTRRVFEDDMDTDAVELIFADDDNDDDTEDDKGNDNGEDDEDKEEEKESGTRAPKVRPWFTVEPWKQVHRGEEGSLLLPGDGEGSFYSGRLHYISGMRNGAYVHRLWYWVKGMTSWLFR